MTKTVVLACDPARAFALFTEHAGQWWPEDRRHTDDNASTIRMEASGRFFERAIDGTEVELGIVRMFEPPHRLSLDWFPGTGADAPTHVDIVFEPVDAGTRVTIEHDAGFAPHDLFARNIAAYDRSWDLVLAAVAAVVSA
jgi:uncharacterized protein YndB with AHSA1/START domain